MGRTKTAAYYRRQADIAEAREAYYRTARPVPTGTVVQSRGGATDLYYRSLNLIEDTEPLIFRVPVLNSTLQRMTAAELGLLSNLTAGDNALRVRGSGLSPTKVHWFQGDATPTRQRTEWGSNWTKYYNETGGRSHYSAPFSAATGQITGSSLVARFNGLFGPAGSKRALLGTANGRAWLEMEQVAIAANS
ncbi:MAG: hypothetical protein ICV77_09765 [Cyanobacteria bacterium Co-bin8]|nr:hypothetical protein [Cyanobacteria bacterium Co-bin8]